MPQTPLEASEKLEQLRALESGYRIKTVVTEHDSFGVDIPEDLSKILQRLEERRD
jgi:3-deoxy-manno-octulosonate cytidylyltransferase (CMP-KDO synthetase)